MASPPAPAGLLVAAAPTLLRHGLLQTLRETWPERPTAFSTDPAYLLARLREQPYALLVVDSAAFAPPALPPLLRQARQLRPQLPLLVLTGRRPPVLALAAPLRLLSQHVPPSEVMRVATELLAPTSLLAAHPRSLRPAAVGFSPRELEVLSLVLDDLSNEQIAARLCLSVRTVESHRRALLHKAGVRTPVGLVVRALREGWVSA